MRIQQPLESVGYMLRPRYHPGWVGSWLGTRRKAETCEDSIGLEGVPIVLDAVRARDGLQVILKLWNRDRLDGAELDALRFFSEPSRANHPSNHVVPLLSTVTIEGCDDFFDKLLVEPLLRDFNEPPFVMVAEALSFILQVLEGLDYMHSNNVAHGSVILGNIMMDPASIFPDGFHGAFGINTTRRVSERHVKRLTRLQAPVKYYYIDFGSSSMFPSAEERTLVRPVAAVWFPPEYLADPTSPLDPFKFDVYTLGITLIEEMRVGAHYPTSFELRLTLSQHRPGLHFIVPFFGPMIAKKPEDRPTAAQLKLNFVRFLLETKPSTMRRRIGWSPQSGITVLGRMWDAKEQVKLLWHSYRYGLPKELFPVTTTV
ncbi:hypothetical protein CALVIDRAFT_483433 [Calocera viscosa TUFC12733]|uniref:Protein kinase domain-containing protein n=1 Tax=Calocera viscosa (strain TUFC12733) TaxID=1330018 RepID=A0A167KVE8_CALVF|nr:hypothetical protein CALVIDRAFT_483433 [Calocera viscosa TUFC12733]